MFKDEIDPPPSKEDEEEPENVYHLMTTSNHVSFEEHFDTSADSEFDEPFLDYESRAYVTRIEKND